MAVLKYRDPVSGEYVPLSLVGQAGDPGPPGPPGPDGSPGPAEIAIGDAAPTAGEKIWVQPAATVKDDGTDETAIQMPMAKFQYHDGSTYKVPAQLQGQQLTDVGSPSVTTDAATVQYVRRGRSVADESWTLASLQNGWVNFGQIHGEYAYAAYRKLGNGLVVIQGLIASGPIPSTVFTLPPGYRPATYKNFANHGGENPVVRVYIQPDGQVRIEAWGSTGSNAHISINSMFYAE